MANNKILGGSPLGLIGVKSYFSSTNMSTFNAGNTRNVNVQKYNTNSSDASNEGNSLFTGKRIFRAWPNIKIVDGVWDTRGLGDVNYADSPEYRDPDTGAITPAVKKGDTSTRKTLHNDTTYDVSVLNIIEKLSGTKAELRPADFAYLKNIGVYPNNRLMIARRFATPAEDNIMTNKIGKEVSSISTLISWVPENQDFLDITFGEEWMEAEADFKGVLTSMGEDIGLGNLGGIGGAAANAIPLPGFTEIFQRAFLSKLKLIEESKANMIPAGNPNLIKQAKRRKTVGYSEASSGLKCQVNIKMVCEYELKYISGIDPTLVWMDLLSMITRFGTSESSGYGLTKGAAGTLKRWVNSPQVMVNELASALATALTDIVTAIKTAVKKAYDAAVAVADELTDETPKTTETVGAKTAQLNAATALQEEGNKFAKEIGDKLKAFGMDALSGLLQKYRVRVIGIINALALLPSTPWHITIGNPMRPTFCSGDMLVENVNLKLGPNLTFNDLPSSMTIEFNITNARPWGMQEIMAKFNSGYLRTIDAQRSYYETKQIKTKDGKDGFEDSGALPLYEYATTVGGSSGTSGSAGSGGSGGTGGTSNGETAKTGTSESTGSSGTSGAVNPDNVSNKGNGANTTTTQNNGTQNTDPNGAPIKQ